MRTTLSANPALPAQPVVAQSSQVGLGWALALTATLFFSFAPPIGRGIIQSGVDSTTLVFIRLTIATLLMGLTVAITDYRLLRIDRRGLFFASLAGSINGMGMLLFFWALERVSASIASMMITLCPLVILSLLWLRGEKFTYRHIIRMALGLGGVYLLIGPGGHADSRGVLLLLIAVLCFSIHMVTLQWYLRDYNVRTATFYVSLAMVGVVATWWWAQGAHWQPLSGSNWVSVAVLAVICTYLSRLAMVAAISIIGSGQMSLLSPLETFCTITWSMIFLDERLAPLQWVGGVLIMISALLAFQRLGRAQWRPRWRMWSRP